MKTKDPNQDKFQSFKQPQIWATRLGKKKSEEEEEALVNQNPLSAPSIKIEDTRNYEKKQKQKQKQNKTRFKI